jgi:hypothetical protein
VRAARLCSGKLSQPRHATKRGFLSKTESCALDCDKVGEAARLSTASLARL